MNEATEVPLRLRVPLKQPLTPMQKNVIALASESWSTQEIAAMLGISDRTVLFHFGEAGKRIPGDLSDREKCVCWWRGADLEVLTGSYVFDVSDLPPAIQQVVKERRRS